MKYLSLIALLFLCSCASRSSQNSSDTVVSMQIIDRNGFSETISAKDRLTSYEKTDFLSTQPYQKVLRVFGRGPNGKSTSKITTYHANGQPWQYLEVADGRAHGKYREWHPNGKLKLETFVIEGTPDVTEMAQMTWLFNDKSYVWDEEGHLIAEIPYEKGLLEGPAFYYYPNGQLSEEIPYHKDEIDGTLNVYNDKGLVIERIKYQNGLREGAAYGLWENGKKSYDEVYKKGQLITGSYFDYLGQQIAKVENGNGKQAVFENGKLSSLIEYQNGEREGEVMNFNEHECLVSVYHEKEGKKYGEEWEYYPSKDGAPKPKLLVHWDDDVIQGVAKTWYENGVLESQREISGNKKHGLCFAWFKEGDLMLMEEYENDSLVKGSYFKKWDKKPTSKVENGKGIATIHDSEGRFLRKIVYEKGVPQIE
jgi:antitoxin component YwqK of YwqJK toxin-antitoxin module